MELILALLDQGFDHKSWHGTNLRGSIRGLTAARASWRPAAGRHNIWEIVLHCAYWKYTVLRRITGGAKGSFPRTGSNWFRRPEGAGREAGWKADVGLLIETHRALREAVALMKPRDLALTPPGSKISHRDILLGIAAHDLYHAGQIQTLKRLSR